MLLRRPSTLLAAAGLAVGCLLAGSPSAGSGQTRGEPLPASLQTSPEGSTAVECRFGFALGGPDRVDFDLIVAEPGPLRLQATWAGGADQLSIMVSRRSFRPRSDRSAASPLARVSGASPLALDLEIPDVPSVGGEDVSGGIPVQVSLVRLGDPETAMGWVLVEGRSALTGPVPAQATGPEASEGGGALTPVVPSEAGPPRSPPQFRFPPEGRPLDSVAGDTVFVQRGVMDRRRAVLRPGAVRGDPGLTSSLTPDDPGGASPSPCPPLGSARTPAEQELVSTFLPDGRLETRYPDGTIIRQGFDTECWEMVRPDTPPTLLCPHSNVIRTQLADLPPELLADATLGVWLEDLAAHLLEAIREIIVDPVGFQNFTVFERERSFAERIDLRLRLLNRLLEAR